MAESTDVFWARFNTAQNLAAQGQASKSLDIISDLLSSGAIPLSDARQSLLVDFARIFDSTFKAPSRTKPVLTPSLSSPILPSGSSELPPIRANGKEGISLVTCVKNRTENLLNAIQSWISFPQISEIIVVDWSSDAPVAPALKNAGITDPRVRVLRVDGEPRWILSYAFNVAFRAARYDKLLKVDADIVLLPDFFERNPLPPKSFVAGNWRTAKTEQVFVNGFFYVTRDVLFEVAGFNEYITTYGWDDDDIYERLGAVGATRIDVADNTIFHQPHSDLERLGVDGAKDQTLQKDITSSTMYYIRRNRFLANVMPQWNKDRMLLPFVVSVDPDGMETLRRRGDVPSSVPEHVERDADYYALAELSSWRLGNNVRALDRLALRSLLSRPQDAITPELIEKAKTQPAAPAISHNKPRFFIDAQHGLGNKMRAIGSAAAIAKATDRDLVIIWQPDHHCECRMSDLFAYDGAVIEESFTGAASALGAQVYNYMEIEPHAAKDAPLDLSWSGDIYARSAYVLNAPPSNWQSENRFIKSLTPASQVHDLIASVRNPNDVSAHVRMVGAPGSDTASYDRVENWTAEGHAAINHWRTKSHYSNFITQLEAMIKEGTANTIFVAADQPETYAAFTKALGDRVVYLQRDLYDRSKDQARYALADAILLSRSTILLGSNWSSFTEMALRVSDIKPELLVSGKDF